MPEDKDQSAQENIIKKIKPHPSAYALYYLAAGLVFIFFVWFGGIFLGLILGLAITAIAELMRRAETFYIGKNGVWREFMLLSANKVFTEYDKIQDVGVEQNLVDLMFGIGKIRINTAGSPEKEIEFYGIKNPYESEKLIREKMKVL